MEFSKDDRKIVLSHTNVYSDPKEEASKADKFTKKKPGEAPKAGKPGDNKKPKDAERSTLEI
jgi:small subunit ribosomal protein S1